MSKSSISVLLIALVLAIGINLFFFITGTELTTVVSRTIFGNLFIVLTLVPIYEIIRLKTAIGVQEAPQRIRSGMAPVAIYTFVLALVTFVLFKLFGGELVAQRMGELRDLLDAAPELTDIEKQQRLDGAARIYSPAAHVLVVLLSTLFVGFISSIIAALVIRK